MKKIQVSSIIDKIIIIFLIIQPIFDLKIFYNSYSTLIRVIIISTIFVYIFIKNNNKKRYIIIYYLILLIIYFIAHHINAQNFFSLVPGNFNYNVIKEILYFIKMLIPYMLIYSIYELEIPKKTLNSIINLLVCIIAGTIIITNFCKVSYGTYTDAIIKTNFLDWFKSNNYTYYDLLSKGLFEYANQIGAVLLMFLSMTLYNLITKKCIKNILIIIINCFSLILLGTRVAVLGIGIVIVYTVIIYYIIEHVIQHKKYVIKKLLVVIPIFLIYITTLSFNPVFSRINEMKNVNYVEEQELENTENQLNQEIKQDNEQEEINESEAKAKYIENNYKSKKILEQFILVSYPYQYDLDFWENVLQMSAEERTNYRYIEQLMIQRVVEINNNDFDMLFGITNTRIQNIFNIEKDFVVQFYALGIVGCAILFLPYFYLIIQIAIKSIKKIVESDTITIIGLISILFIFFISYYSGNLLNSLSFTIYLALIFSIAISKTEREEKGEWQ